MLSKAKISISGRFVSGISWMIAVLVSALSVFPVAAYDGVIGVHQDSLNQPELIAEAKESSELKSSSSGPGILTKYCLKLEKHLASISSSLPDKSAFINCRVDSSGALSKIRARKGSFDSRAEFIQAIQKLKASGNFPPPPKSPLNLNLDLNPPSYNVSASEGDFNYSPWLGRIERKIKANWLPPIKNNTEQTVVRYKINRDGKIFDVRVHTSSGNKEYDKRALEAVKSVKLEGAPDGSPKWQELEFSFDYKVHKARKDRAK